MNRFDPNGSKRRGTMLQRYFGADWSIWLTAIVVGLGQEGFEQLTIADLMSTSLITAYPDETLRDVLQKMGPRDLSRLPVVSRDDPRTLLGVVRRNDVVRAYNVGLTRRHDVDERVSDGLRGVGLVDFVEVVLGPRAACAGKVIAEIAPLLPKDSLLISIRRADGSVVFPRGDTRLEIGDRVIAHALPAHIDPLRAVLSSEAPPDAPSRSGT